MEITWSNIKEVFFAIGSIAGVFALARPLVESKFQRDVARVDRIKSLINEQALVDLENRIYQNRQVDDEYFHPFDQLAHEKSSNQDGIRFTGPFAKHLGQELDALISAYYLLRKFIQVNEWEPRTHTRENGTKYISWDFNKSAFEQQDGIARDYAQHLDEAAEQAVQMKKAYQRFQLVAELHLFETPIAGCLLQHRFKAHSLR